MITDKERIRVLRQRCLDRKQEAWRDISIGRARGWSKSAKVESLQERQGWVTREVLSLIEFETDDLELLAGRFSRRPAWITEELSVEAEAVLADYPVPGGQRGHCELDMQYVLLHGIDGIAGDISDRLSRSTGAKAATYRSYLYALEGLTLMIEHAGECAGQAISESLPGRQTELERVWAACNRIAHQPPETFFEAMQLLWLVLLAVQQGEMIWLVGPGHIDRTLWPFYTADIMTGKLSHDEALVLVESLYLLINEFIPDGLAIPVMIGGRDAGGKDVTNEVSYICLEALRRTKLVYPTVGICWHEETPEELIEKAIELITHGYASAAFFGDETIQKGLRRLGVPREETCYYVNSTCVEITPALGSNIWVASPYYTLCGLLLDEIAAAAGGNQPETFEAFKCNYYTRLRNAVSQGVACENRLRHDRERLGGKPLQSVFTRDCIKKGMDIDRGGARYNWVECSFVGLANLIDSLHVIEEEVYKRKSMNVSNMHTILEANYTGYEPERQRFQNRHAKYGQNETETDKLACEVVKNITELCGEYRMYPGDSPYVPGVFVWEMHERMGRETGATPDGRQAGKPFADGAGPAQGRESKGPTAAILSTTSWEHSQLIGGVAFNMKFNTSLLTGNGPARLKDLVMTYLKRGGFEVQINVINHETLQKARNNPDEYRDLVIRVGGYTDYYTRLPVEMQEEILHRTEYQ